MATPATTPKWHLAGEEVVSCNCDWGCPCQFSALPTHGNCEAFGVWQIRRGHYGEVKLDGLRFARFFWWPAAIHKGNGVRQFVLEPQATPEQRQALQALESGEHGGPFFEIFAGSAPTVRPLLIAPITVEADREARTATVRITDVAEIHAEPIKNPVTGEPHRVRIDLPNGFEFKQAEVANSTFWRLSAGEKLTFEHRNSYAQFATFDWSN